MIKIKKAEVGDILGLNELLYQVHDVHAQGRPDIFKKGAKKYNEVELEEIIKNENTPIFVAIDENSNEVLGHMFCIFKEVKDHVSLENRKILFIDDLCVHEKARGQKIGQKFCDFALELCKKENCHSLTLDIWNFNEGALKFYERLGFKPLKTVMEMKI